MGRDKSPLTRNGEHINVLEEEGIVRKSMAQLDRATSSHQIAVQSKSRTPSVQPVLTKSQFSQNHEMRAARHGWEGAVLGVGRGRRFTGP